MIVTIQRANRENFVLPIPDEILQKLGCKIGDEFHVAVVQPNLIVLTKCPLDTRTKAWDDFFSGPRVSDDFMPPDTTKNR
jgi:hypothetical protein